MINDGNGDPSRANIYFLESAARGDVIFHIGIEDGEQNEPRKDERFGPDSGDFLGVTDFFGVTVGNNRKIDRALFSGSEQENDKWDNINDLQELDHFYIRNVTPAPDPIV